MITHSFTIPYSKRPLDFLGWVLVCAMEFFLLLFSGFALNWFLGWHPDDIYNRLLPFIPLFLGLNILWYLKNRKRLQVDVADTSITFSDGDKRSVQLLRPVEYKKAWSYSFIEQTNINIPNPTSMNMGAERGHSTSEVLILIMRGARGKIVVFSKELPPWGQSPAGMDYVDSSGFTPEYKYSVNNFERASVQMIGAFGGLDGS